MPAKFDSFGIAFQYPDNWTLDEEDVHAGQNCATVYSPGGGFWSVAIHPSSTQPAELAVAVVEAMKGEYEELEVADARQTIAGHQLVGYNLSFYYLDLINTAEIRCLRTDKASYSIFCQAEDREFDEIRPIFKAMATSLLREL